MKFILVQFLLCFLVVATQSHSKSGKSTETPLHRLLNHVKTCNVRNSKTLDVCLLDLVAILKNDLVVGIPEWNVPPMEPLNIRSLSIGQGSGAARIRSTFKKLEVFGLSNYTISHIRTNPADYTLRVGLIIPELTIKGEYEIDGQILIVPIVGNGPFWANLRGVTAETKSSMRITSNHLDLYKSDTDFNINKMKMKLDNLFNGDKLLGNTVNQFLNENTQEIIKEFRPRFAKEIDRIVVKAFKEALANIPVDVWKAAI